MTQAQSNNAMAIDEAAFAALCAEAAREAEATEQAQPAPAE